MPLYTLSCNSCGKRFERILKLSDPVENETCLHCNKKTLQKTITTFSNYSIKGDNGSSVRPKGAGRIGGSGK